MIKFNSFFRKIILARGESLYLNNKVSNVKRNGSSFTANVLGSKSYRVNIELGSNNQLIGGNCSCPCEENCKHMAALLYYLNDNDIASAKELASLANVINSLDINKLRELLLSLASSNLDIMDNILKLDNKPKPKEIKDEAYYLNKLREILDSYIDPDDLCENPFLGYNHYDDYNDFDPNEDVYLEGKQLINSIALGVEDIAQAKGIYLSILDMLNDYTYIEDIASLIECLFNNIEEVALKDSDSLFPLKLTRRIAKLEYIPLDYLKLSLVNKENGEAILNTILASNKRYTLELIKGIFDILEYSPLIRLDILKDNNELDIMLYRLELYLEVADYDNFDLLYKKSIAFNDGFIQMDYEKRLYELSYLRYLNNDNNKALDSLRNRLAIDFSKELYLKSLELSTKEAEIKYYEENNNIHFLKKLFLELEDYTSLMNILLKNKDIWGLKDNYELLKDKFRNEYIAFYSCYIIDRLRNASNRNDYRSIADYGEDLIDLKIDRDKAMAIARLIKGTYPKKRALLEEFNFFFRYAEGEGK